MVYHKDLVDDAEPHFDVVREVRKLRVEVDAIAKKLLNINCGVSPETPTGGY